MQTLKPETESILVRVLLFQVYTRLESHEKGRSERLLVASKSVASGRGSTRLDVQNRSNSQIVGKFGGNTHRYFLFRIFIVLAAPSADVSRAGMEQRCPNTP